MDYGKPMRPDNHMVWAILSTLFCCLPLGIVSIISASKVDTLYASGAYDEAQTAADNAKKWAERSLVLTIVGWTLYCIFAAALLRA